MRVLIPVYFNAPLGGVQSYVRAQANALLRAGHACRIMCKPGPFSDGLRRAGIDTIETTFQDVTASVVRACDSGRYGLVHAHPFQSLAVGKQVAARQRVPLVCTFHGTALDALPAYADSVDLCITVSAAIRDLIVDEQILPASRVLVIPNGVDTEVFNPAAADLDALRSSVRSLGKLEVLADDRRVLFVSRLDADKRFILDVVMETWEEMQRTRAFDIMWWVAGDGSLLSEMEQAATELSRAAGRELVHFLGWQHECTLAALYNNCHLAIAPGRSALESMACARPVIAIGSKGYIGLIDDERALEGVYGNFGGLGRKHQDYRPGSMFEAIDSVIYDDYELERLGKLSLSVVNAFHRQKDLDAVLLRHYEILSKSAPRSERRVQYAPVRRRVLDMTDSDCPEAISSVWRYPKSESRAIEAVSEGRVCAKFSLAEGKHFYFQGDRAGFASPPTNQASWCMDPSRQYRFAVRLSVLEGSPRVAMWVIQYDPEQRLTHSVLNLKPGINQLEMVSSAQTTCFRALFRFSGSGAVELGPIAMAEKQQASRGGLPPDFTLTRTCQLPDFHEYQGDNLVFVVGPPRSGTTWLLNLLAAHPDVVAATVDNLKARINDLQTLETNVFNDNRPFTDAQIRRKFHRLSQQERGKVIVEKTPVHLLYVDRIRRIFPKAAIVLIDRDGRDVVTSLVHVGRSKSAWWQGAPETVEKATELWRTYAEAALECVRTQAPYRVQYERLLDNAADCLADLLAHLGLSTDYVETQIEACQGGKNIPIPGVFREGRKGGWRKLFKPEDVATFERVAGDLLERLGYEPD